MDDHSLLDFTEFSTIRVVPPPTNATGATALTAAAAAVSQAATVVATESIAATLPVAFNS